MSEEDGLFESIRKYYEQEEISRRSFLKMLGLGTGGLAVSSFASSLFKITDKPETSNLNADQLQGKSASQLSAIKQKQVANKFTEDYVSTSFSSTEPLTNFGTTGDNADPDTSDSSFSNIAGMGFNPNINLAGVRFQISSLCSGFTRAYLYDSNWNKLADKDISGKSGGDYVKFIYTLESGSKYYVGFDAEGSGYTRAYNTSTSFPYTSSDLDVVSSFNGTGSDRTSDLYNIDQVTAITASKGSIVLKDSATSGSVTVEFDRNNDVYEWDKVTFQRTLDGETVDVYIEESTDGGSTWSEVAGPISRGFDLSSVVNSSSSYVRVRADISRSSTSNNPSLDLVARRWKV